MDKAKAKGKKTKEIKLQKSSKEPSFQNCKSSKKPPNCQTILKIVTNHFQAYKIPNHPQITKLPSSTKPLKKNSEYCHQNLLKIPNCKPENLKQIIKPSYIKPINQQIQKL